MQRAKSFLSGMQNRTETVPSELDRLVDIFSDFPVPRVRYDARLESSTGDHANVAIFRSLVSPGDDLRFPRWDVIFGRTFTHLRDRRRQPHRLQSCVHVPVTVSTGKSRQIQR
jgi:hypothetical protein